MTTMNFFLVKTSKLARCTVFRRGSRTCKTNSSITEIFKSSWCEVLNYCYMGCTQDMPYKVIKQMLLRNIRMKTLYINTS